MDSEAVPAFATGLLIGLFVCFISMICLDNAWKAEAVREGVAEWSATEKGNAEWKWIEVKE